MASQLTSSPAKPPKVLESSKFQVRRDIAETTQDVIPTSTSLPSHQDRSLHFKIDPAANKCINLSLMKLHLKYRVVDKNSYGIGAGNLKESLPTYFCSIIPGNPLASIFKDVKIKLNGVPVTDSNELYPWINKHLYLTKVPPVYRKATQVSGRVYHDTEAPVYMDYDPSLAAEADVKKWENIVKEAKALLTQAGSDAEKKKTAQDSLNDKESILKRAKETLTQVKSQTPPGGKKADFDENRWKDLNMRCAWYDPLRTSELDLCNYLFTDLTTAPSAVIIPPDVTVEVELQPNDPARTILMSHRGFRGEPKLVVEILSAELIVPRILPMSESIPKRITHQFMAVNAQPVFITKGSTNYHGVVTFPGSLPSRLSVLFISRGAYDGDYESNMYNAHSANVESITFNAGGTIFPSSPLTAAPSRGLVANMYLRTAESLRFSLDKTQMTLPPSMNDYRDEDFIYSADISSDYSADSTWTTRAEQGSVAVNMHFTKPVEDDTVALIISESVASLKIEDSRIELIK